jgi:hypothetical protein
MLELRAIKVLGMDAWIPVEAQNCVQMMREKLRGDGNEDSRMGAGEPCKDPLLVPQKRSKWHTPHTGSIFVGQVKHLP